MSSAKNSKRRAVMGRSMALGHCICDPKLACPCEALRRDDICHCAGEWAPAAAGEVRLTQHVRNAGCASKIPKQLLQEVLADLPGTSDPRVLVGAAAGDDAGVIVLSPGIATILTVDVFCPSVDDPYTFGQIAAANSLSDIYAMGGAPQAALSIIGFPVSKLPGSAMREILRGGADKMKEAGVAIVGGHSIQDDEIKCGFAVVGTSSAEGFIRNAGARPGDVLLLTKPLGSGILAFAGQIGRASAEALGAMARSAATLNRAAGERLGRFGVHAATDITGFGLLGHLEEIARNSDVEIGIDFDALPLFEMAGELARGEVLPGAVERNRESVDGKRLEMAGLSAAEQSIVFGPETSGGILACVPAARAREFAAELAGVGVTAWEIGRVTGPRKGGFIRVTKSSQSKTAATAAGPRSEAASSAGSEIPCCCQDDGAAKAGVQGEAGGSAATVTQGEGLPAAARGDAFRAYMAAVNAPGALDNKTRKLINLALSVATKCEACVKINAKAAREAGAGEEELAEAAALGIAFGGASAAMFYNKARGG